MELVSTLVSQSVCLSVCLSLSVSQSGTLQVSHFQIKIVWKKKEQVICSILFHTLMKSWNWQQNSSY